MKINLLRSIQGFLMTILLILTIVVQPATAASGAIAETQKSNYAPNEPIVVEYSNFPTDYAGYAYDWIGIGPSGSADNNYEQWLYTYGSRSGSLSFNGLNVGDYEVRGYFGVDYKVHTRSSFTVGEDKSLKYGESYYIQNQESSSENYLSISPGLPGWECVHDLTKHSIFIDSVLDMKEETRSWKFVSASGAEDGTPVSIGDIVYLQNQGPDGNSYLNSCGQVDPPSTDKVYVYTNEKQDWAGVGTGKWKIVSASGAEDGTLVSIDDLISLENQWTFEYNNSLVEAYSFLRTCNPTSCDLNLEYGNSIIGDKDLPGTGAGVWKIIGR